MTCFLAFAAKTLFFCPPSSPPTALASYLLWGGSDWGLTERHSWWDNTVIQAPGPASLTPKPIHPSTHSCKHERHHISHRWACQHVSCPMADHLVTFFIPAAISLEAEVNLKNVSENVLARESEPSVESFTSSARVLGQRFICLHRQRPNLGRLLLFFERIHQQHPVQPGCSNLLLKKCVNLTSAFWTMIALPFSTCFAKETNFYVVMFVTVSCLDLEM